jgi:hypothetical protein
MSLRYALLGLLAEEPASGYDLAGKFERNLWRIVFTAPVAMPARELSTVARAACDVAALAAPSPMPAMMKPASSAVTARVSRGFPRAPWSRFSTASRFIARPPNE